MNQVHKITLIFLLFCFPVFSFAQLTSENYQVSSPRVGTAEQSSVGTSTNYIVETSDGSTYVYDEPDSNPNQGGGGGGVTDPVPPPTPTPPPPIDPPPPTPTPPPPVDPAPSPTPSPPSSPDTSEDESEDTEDGGGSGGSGGGSGEAQNETPEVTENNPRESTSQGAGFSVITSTIVPAVIERVVVVSERAQSIVRETNTAIKKVVEDLRIPEPVVETFGTTAEAGVGTGFALSALLTLRLPFSLTNVWRLLVHGWHHLFQLFVFWKRRRPWGTVYDSVTKAPLDPAYVELFDSNGKKKGEAITDLDGRYGFIIPPGAYTMRVKKTNYQFPSKRKLLTKNDTVYTNVYFGDAFEASESVTHDIPMDPETFDWNQYEKMRTHQTRFIHRIDPYVVRLFEFIFYVGTAVTVWQFLVDPSWYTGILLSLYFVLMFIHIRKGKPPLYGTIVKKKGGTVVPFALVKVMQGKATIASKVTDEYGRYVALVPPGTYTLQIDERVGEEMYETVYDDTVVAKKGIINESLAV